MKIRWVLEDGAACVQMGVDRSYYTNLDKRFGFARIVRVGRNWFLHGTWATGPMLRDSDCYPIGGKEFATLKAAKAEAEKTLRNSYNRG